MAAGGASHAARRVVGRTTSRTSSPTPTPTLTLTLTLTVTLSLSNPNQVGPALVAHSRRLADRRANPNPNPTPTPTPNPNQVLDGEAHLPFCCVRPPGDHVT